MSKTNETQQATVHTPEPWTYNHTAIVQDSQGNILADCEIVPASESSAPAAAEEIANACRIVAAVNACKGISTEALERGVITEPRHILSELLTAASDLDAAIDGATEEFEDERKRLNAVIDTAQAVLDGGMELDLHELLAGRKQIAAIWSVEDVQDVRPDLTDEQAWDVLHEVGRKHDAEYGINWTTLECMAEILFGLAPETTDEED